MCQCRHKTPAILPVVPIRAAVNLGGDAVGFYIFPFHTALSGLLRSWNPFRFLRRRIDRDRCCPYCQRSFHPSLRPFAPVDRSEPAPPYHAWAAPLNKRKATSWLSCSITLRSGSGWWSESVIAGSIDWLRRACTALSMFAATCRRNTVRTVTHPADPAREAHLSGWTA